MREFKEEAVRAAYFKKVDSFAAVAYPIISEAIQCGAREGR